MTRCRSGVVTLAERFGQAGFDPDGFEAMVDDVAARLESFEAVHCIGREIREGGVQLLGTSGTVTTLAGVALGLPRYRRPLVDGTVLSADAADEALADLRALGRRGTGGASLRRPGAGGLRAAGLRGVRRPGAAVAGAAGDRGRSRPARGHAAAHDPRRPRGAGAGEAAARHPAPRGLAVAVRTAKGRSVASQRWLARQLNDPYVAAAKQQGFRSRAAFKLVGAGRAVPADPARARWWSIWAPRRAAGRRWRCSAARRGWSGWICCRSIRWRARCMLQGDFTDAEVQERLLAELGGKADLVLSDMAPNTTGHAATDHLRIMALAEAALEFALEVLAEGGGFVAKVFQGGAEQDDAGAAQAAFRGVRHAKPPASRKESSELYVVATGFRVTRE